MDLVKLLIEFCHKDLIKNKYKNFGMICSLINKNKMSIKSYLKLELIFHNSKRSFLKFNLEE